MLARDLTSSFGLVFEPVATRECYPVPSGAPKFVSFLVSCLDQRSRREWGDHHPNPTVAAATAGIVPVAGGGPGGPRRRSSRPLATLCPRPWFHPRASSCSSLSSPLSPDGRWLEQLGSGVGRRRFVVKVVSVVLPPAAGRTSSASCGRQCRIGRSSSVIGGRPWAWATTPSGRCGCVLGARYGMTTLTM